MDQRVLQYIDSVPKSRRAHIDTLHGLVLKCFPDVDVTMKYRMPTYSLGRGWVAIANQKNYVSLYTCSATHLAVFRPKHRSIKTGKGCINFREKDVIPVDDVIGVITHAITEPKAE
jgi:uncharacterized protein YdhG (YjbR/CyaY superfamily)